MRPPRPGNRAAFGLLKPPKMSQRTTLPMRPRRCYVTNLGGTFCQRKTRRLRDDPSCSGWWSDRQGCNMLYLRQPSLAASPSVLLRMVAGKACRVWPRATIGFHVSGTTLSHTSLTRILARPCGARSARQFYQLLPKIP